MILELNALEFENIDENYTECKVNHLPRVDYTDKNIYVSQIIMYVLISKVMLKPFVIQISKCPS